MKKSYVYIKGVILFLILTGVIISTQSDLAANEKIKADYIILDVRTKAEFDGGYVPGAINITHTKVAEFLPKLIQNKARKIFVYCASGGRSNKVLQELKKLGYTQVKDLGGYKAASDYFQKISLKTP